MGPGRFIFFKKKMLKDVQTIKIRPCLRVPIFLIHLCLILFIPIFFLEEQPLSLLAWPKYFVIVNKIFLGRLYLVNYDQATTWILSLDIKLKRRQILWTIIKFVLLRDSNGCVNDMLAYNMANKDQATKVLVFNSSCNNASPNFLSDSNCFIFRKSNEVSFIPDNHLESGQKSQKLVQLFVHKPMSVTLTRLQFGPFHNFWTYVYQSITL